MAISRIFSKTYRYGFNGKELDTEGMGGGLSTYDYGFRIYNPAIARFLSVDPLSPEYPWYTPYQFAGNMPICAIDLDGLEPFLGGANWIVRTAPILESPKPTIRPVIEQTVRTGIGKPSWKSSMSRTQNILERTLRWGTKNHDFIKQLPGNMRKAVEVTMQKGKGGSIADMFEITTKGGKRIANIEEIKSGSEWGKQAGAKHLERLVKDFVKSGEAERLGIDEIQPHLTYYIPSVAGGIFYEVKKGDNLWSISKDFGVDIKTLYSLNGYSDKDNTIQPGQKLLIQPIIENLPENVRPQTSLPSQNNNSDSSWSNFWKFLWNGNPEKEFD